MKCMNGSLPSNESRRGCAEFIWMDQSCIFSGGDCCWV
jgi:hypothetical protein